MRLTFPPVFILAPLLMALIFLPLALGLIPPNSLYGYRTARSLSSPDLDEQRRLLVEQTFNVEGIRDTAPARQP